MFVNRGAFPFYSIRRMDPIETLLIRSRGFWELNSRLPYTLRLTIEQRIDSLTIGVPRRCPPELVEYAQTVADAIASRSPRLSEHRRLSLRFKIVQSGRIILRRGPKKESDTLPDSCRMAIWRSHPFPELPVGYEELEVRVIFELGVTDVTREAPPEGEVRGLHSHENCSSCGRSFRDVDVAWSDRDGTVCSICRP